MKEYFRKLTADAKTGYIAVGAVAVIALLTVTQSPTLQEPEGNATIEVGIQIDYSDSVDNYTEEVVNGSTVFDALNKTADVEYQEYSIGYFVTGINDVSQNSTHSWMYFVNGESPSKAVNEYNLEDDDRVAFRFMSNNRSAELVG